MSVSQFAIPRKCEVPVGAYAVWQIPDLNVTIPVYQGRGGMDSQRQIDKENSASIYRFGVGRIIADHAESKAGKGIWDISQVRPDTVGFMVMPNGDTIQYVCNQVCRVMVHPTCYTLDGMSVYPRSSTDIMCISCANPQGTENYLAVFKYKGKMP